MAEESRQSALTLEQAHLAVMRGQWGEARRLLEPLVAREPGNAAAQDLFAQVIAFEARRQEEVNLALGTALPPPPPRPGSTIWTRPFPGSSPTARKWVVMARIGIALVILGPLLARNFWPNPKNEHIATSLVNAAYQTATVSASNEASYASHWERIERQYGRVRSWHILSSRRSFPGGDWDYTVAVSRERADTTEVAEAVVGPSRSRGFDAKVRDVWV